MLLNRLEQARSNDDHSSLLLSGWNADDEDKKGVIEDLCSYFVDLNSPLEEVTLQNCQGDLQRLVATILHSSPKRFIIRFDKQQQSIPLSIANGLIQGAEGNSRIRSLSLRGMTLTPSVMESLQLALPQCAELECLSIKGHFLLRELDKKGISILGSRHNHESVVHGLEQILKDIPHLQSLHLEHCHIPDIYLAQLLAAAATSSRHLTSLKLRGNLAQTLTLTVLHDWLIRPTCTLTHLDLSWQRLPLSKKNYSMFADLPLLAEALIENTSLHTLQLSENRLLDAHVAKLATALQVNSTLQTLELKDCRISNFAVLAKALPKFHLRRLDLNGHQRGHRRSEGAPKLKSLFFKPLTHNVFLYDLVLPHGEVSKSLSWVLEWNRAGRRVQLIDEDSRFPPNLWPLLLERADRIGRQQASEQEANRHGAAAIYCLLRQKGTSACSGRCQ
jgi:hypothetical protein